MISRPPQLAGEGVNGRLRPKEGPNLQGVRMRLRLGVWLGVGVGVEVGVRVRCYLTHEKKPPPRTLQ